MDEDVGNLGTRWLHDLVLDEAVLGLLGQVRGGD